MYWPGHPLERLDSLLFYATDLPQDASHRATVANQEDRTLALRAGGLNTTLFGNSTTSLTGSSSSSSIPAGTIAAIVLAVVLVSTIVGIFYYACRLRRNARATNQRAFLSAGRVPSDEKREADIERATTLTPPCGEEPEFTCLSTRKGYSFGLCLRRGFLFASRKNKSGSTSSARSRNRSISQIESYTMTIQRDRDERRLSAFTLTGDLPVLVRVPESEKLAPGWSNPVTRPPPSFKYSHFWDELHGLSLPMRVQPSGPADDDVGDDADVKTLAPRQDETIAATLSLSPRTSEALASIARAAEPRLDINAQDTTRHSDEIRPLEFLQVRDISPFRIDVSAILGPRKGNRDSRRTSGSSNSTWSKVRARLYRRAHRDDGRQGTDKQDASNYSGPESVPVVKHESGRLNPNNGATTGSDTYSFLDLTSPRASLRQHLKTTAPSSTPAELSHGAVETSPWGESTSPRRVKMEHLRNDVPTAEPDVTSTASGGSHPSDDVRTPTALSVAPAQTQAASPFPFPPTIPSSPCIARPPDDNVPERHTTPSPPCTTPSPSVRYFQIPQVTSPGLAHIPIGSPTESDPFSVSDIHFRHSFSDHAGLDSRRASVTSVLLPHSPPPHCDNPESSTPPYVVQRVLGWPTSSPSPLSLTSYTGMIPNGLNTLSGIRRPRTAPTQPLCVDSLLGPQPRPVTAGSIRGFAAPQLPMQGGRSSLLRLRHEDG